MLDLIPVGGKTHQHENLNFSNFTYCKVDHLSLKYYFYCYWYRLTPIWSLILIIIYFRSSCDSWRGRWGLSKDNGHRCKLVPIHTIYNILFHLIIYYNVWYSVTQFYPSMWSIHIRPKITQPLTWICICFMIMSQNKRDYLYVTLSGFIRGAHNSEFC